MSSRRFELKAILSSVVSLTCQTRSINFCASIEYNHDRTVEWMRKIKQTKQMLYNRMLCVQNATRVHYTSVAVHNYLQSLRVFISQSYSTKFIKLKKLISRFHEEGESVAKVPASVQGISYFIYFEWPTNFLWSSTSEVKIKHIPHSEQSHIFFKSSGFKFVANTTSEGIVFN
jgi:hypothetical protein